MPELQPAQTPAAPRRRRTWEMLAGGVAVIVVALAIRYWWNPLSVQAQSGPQYAGPKASLQPKSATAVPTPPEREKPQVVAVVNREEISRNELAQQALWHHGQDVLEALINKHVVAQQCKQRGIEVTPKEVQLEIERLAKRFGLPTDQYLNMLQEGRNINPQQYADDMVWPTLALRKLADEQLQVTPEELDRAYQSEFGPAVKVRLIACNSQEKAQRVHQEALAHPEEFPNLAKDHSDDRNSASARGLIQPIRHHVGDANVERIAFALQPGQISEIIPVGSQWVILRCEEHLPAREVPRENVAEVLREGIRDKKLHDAASDLFRQLQDAARVENIFNDPAKRKQMPGVAAIINGQQVTMRELAEECIERHGVEVLEGTINRRLLEQALRERNLTVADADLDAEVARAALLMGKVDQAGRPDVQGWLDTVEEEQGIPIDLYVHDAVWPSVALKKLVGDQVEVAPDDLKRGFEANYGPRVRCRAIVFNDLRRAQEVWEMARRNPTVEYFGDLAEQYSVEATSRSLRGQVPPIQRWGGQPLLEEEAFRLQPGELSGVVQVGDKFVMMLCEGKTEPKKVAFEEVQALLREDIYEKKLRIAMAEHFTELQDTAQIDNYLAGTSQSPKAKKADKLQQTPEEEMASEIRRASAELPLAPGQDPSREIIENAPRAGSINQSPASRR